MIILESPWSEFNYEIRTQKNAWNKTFILFQYCSCSWTKWADKQVKITRRNKQSHSYDFVTFVFVCLWHCVLRMLISWVKCPRGSWISPPSRMNRAEWLWSFTHDHLKLPRIQVCPCSYSQGLGSIVHMISLDIHLTSISWIQATVFLKKIPPLTKFLILHWHYLCWCCSCIHKM